jgi:predicted O-linked N-acetylglucosamine transferase (SPINDLY family)
VAASELCDGPGFARAVEAAYRDFWRAWCGTTTAARPARAEAEATYRNILTNAMTHQAEGRLGEATALYRSALQVRPDLAEAHSNLAAALHEQGVRAESRAAYGRALALRPDDVMAHSNLLLTLNYDETVGAEDMWAAHAAYGRRWDKGPRAHANPRDPERRLRVGYVSADFKMHSCAFFIEPLLRHHDRAAFEAVCYSGVERPDLTTAELRRLAAGWRDVGGLGDQDFAAQIERDGIDILVDLSGHTRLNRLPVFGMRPAPVQVSWLGYPNTTGLAAIGYRLTDGWADPPGRGDGHYSERLVRLDRCFLCYAPPADAPVVAPLPALAGGGVTFGCFNNANKLNPGVAGLWARLVASVPGARLLLKAKHFLDEGTRAHYRSMFAAAGLASDRLELAGWVAERQGHLGAYGRVDIALDPFPYNGTTTTCEALWMGVPVVALAGERHAGRVGVSLLRAAGLGELVAASEVEYVATAARLAGDVAGLARLRAALRGRVAASELCDGPGFARAVEAAYRDFWRAWCDGIPAQQPALANGG